MQSQSQLRPLAVAACLWLGACAGAPAPSSDTDSIASAIEPSLRAAAANAEATNDWPGAAQHWRTLFQRRPGDPELALALARALRNAGDPRLAADVMAQMVERHGRRPDLLAEQGKDYLAGDRPALALASLEEAATKAPDDWRTVSAAGVALDVLERFPEAEIRHRQAVELSKGLPEARNNLALSLALAGNLEAAIAELRAADGHAQAGSQIRHNLAILTAVSGDPAGAERLAARDLPADQVKANAGAYRRLAGTAP